MVVRRHGINADSNQLSHWFKLCQPVGGSAGEAVILVLELADSMKQIRELKRMLGKKTMKAKVSVSRSQLTARIKQTNEDKGPSRAYPSLGCCDREAISWVASANGYSGDDVREGGRETFGAGNICQPRFNG